MNMVALHELVHAVVCGAGHFACGPHSHRHAWVPCTSSSQPSLPAGSCSLMPQTRSCAPTVVYINQEDSHRPQHVFHHCYWQSSSRRLFSPPGPRTRAGARRVVSIRSWLLMVQLTASIRHATGMSETAVVSHQAWCSTGALGALDH